MKCKSKKRTKLERDNRDWRTELIETIGCCQLPDCIGEWPKNLCVHEIACGTAGRNLSFARRCACLVVCSYCNSHRLTDYSLWPVGRQAALQCLLLADQAAPEDILLEINVCRGRSANSINWGDVAKFLEIRMDI